MMTVAEEIDVGFPVGMRVLAVDDNPTCLKLLEALLRKCKYHVTTTNHATTALKLLRDNKNKFDLVISDVDMPDMDGFKLLELVGLEMDLPVIMLSAYGDTKLVTKGITHGACDYLLKPVRIEELKNIWQHVLRRKKFDFRAQKSSEKVNGISGELVEDLMGTGDTAHLVKLGMKRNDPNYNDDEKRDENSQPNEDPSAQKKTRVVWTPQLHRKFVAAIHQLGIDNAFPKKILEVMNVEKLTSKNVASHLQKYRTYLRRIGCVAKQTNMIAAMRTSNSAYNQNGSPSGFMNVESMTTSSQFPNAAYKSFSPGTVFDKLNTPTGFGMCGLSSSGNTQSGTGCLSINPVSGIKHSMNVLHSMPMSQDVDQPQYRGSGVHPASSGFLNRKIDISNTSNSVLDTADNCVMLAAHLQAVQRKGFAEIQSSVTAASSNSEHSPNVCRSTDSYPDAAQSSAVQLEPIPKLCIKQPISDDLSYMISAMRRVTHSHGASSVSPELSGASNTGTDIQCWTPLLMNGIEQNLDFTMKQDWHDLEQDMNFQSNLTCRLMSSSEPPHGALAPFNHRSDAMDSHVNGDNYNAVGIMDFLYPLPRQHTAIELTAIDLKPDSFEEQRKPKGCLDYDNIDFFEDLVNSMIKK